MGAMQRRLSTFVDWIKPDPAMKDKIRKQVEEIRTRLVNQASADDLTVRSTPNSGSYAKATGLRRHLAGDSVVEGMDVDLPFVVSPKTRDGETLDSLLDRFEGYARASYPTVALRRTKSSVNLAFTGTKLSYDIVPMLATGDDSWQELIRADGSRLRTSVQRHIEFVRSRNRDSDAHAGRVRFHECVRLVKWWRCFKEAGSSLSVPTFHVDLLCAAAFDAVGVQKSYAGTLAEWFGWLALVVESRRRIAFTDFTRIPAARSDWEVLDPVNQANNIVAGWANWQREELREWLEDGRDVLHRAIAADLRGDDARARAHLVELMGSPIKHHGGD